MCVAETTLLSPRGASCNEFPLFIIETIKTRTGQRLLDGVPQSGKGWRDKAGGGTEAGTSGATETASFHPDWRKASGETCSQTIRETGGVRLKSKNTKNKINNNRLKGRREIRTDNRRNYYSPP